MKAALFQAEHLRHMRTVHSGPIIRVIDLDSLDAFGTSAVKVLHVDTAGFVHISAEIAGDNLQWTQEWRLDNFPSV